MVKLVKRCLKKIVANAHLTFEELNTILIEIEGIINSRPLTYVDADSLDEPLTPSSLVSGRRLSTKTPFDPNLSLDSSKTSLSTRESYLKLLLKHFWTRFLREYLPGLREFHRNASTQNNRLIGLGDIVIIQSDRVPRQKWRMGRVITLYPGKDGIVRAANVKTLDAAGRDIVLKRSIVHLYPLEIREERDCSTVEEVNMHSTDSDIEIRCVTDSDVPNIIIDTCK